MRSSTGTSETTETDTTREPAILPTTVLMGPRRALTDAEWDAKARRVYDHADRIRTV